MPSRKLNTSPNTNNNPSTSFPKPHNTFHQNNWITMTETTISEDADIKCTPMPNQKKPTSPVIDISTDSSTSHYISIPERETSCEASYEASCYIGRETEIGTATGFPRYSPRVVDQPPRFLERDGCRCDIDSGFDMEINPDNDDDNDEYHYTSTPTYTHTTEPSSFPSPSPSPSPPHPSHPHPYPHSPHSPPPQSSQLSHIPRTPHSLHIPSLISFFPALKNRDEHFTTYFKNVHFFKDHISIPREPESESGSQSRDTSDPDSELNPDDSPRDEQSKEEEEEEEDKKQQQQNFIPEDKGNKTIDPRIRIDRGESSPRTSSILQISVLDEEVDHESYERDPYPESEFDISSTSSSSVSEDKVDGC
ncbi:uncharacterized protein EAF01_001525 [Botrytis porri]|uniref:Uncharacterized protein n=1 Tax=Botrytis porri TaxID=87229 RepID=A0A4Z1KHU0_9HELO|nr:uncharacterized protein EAF01_001525 [Botrytis porri]KAF7912504.1 hypothetical protein EAF01_001525 [Botrytis porri]TGO85108.1 hypothetical protein BPOR_0430g00020 [Botrytis porri]